MGTSAEPTTGSTFILHARDGVWSCEGVILPNPSTRAACTGFQTLYRLHLPALWITVKPLSFPPVILCVPVITPLKTQKLVLPRPPPLLTVRYQELLLPYCPLENAGEGGGETLARQPMRIRFPAQLPQ